VPRSATLRVNLLLLSPYCCMCHQQSAHASPSWCPTSPSHGSVRGDVAWSGRTRLTMILTTYWVLYPPFLFGMPTPSSPNPDGRRCHAHRQLVVQALRHCVATWDQMDASFWAALTGCSGSRGRTGTKRTSGTWLSIA
jgi:hypothetical protein